MKTCSCFSATHCGAVQCIQDAPRLLSTPGLAGCHELVRALEGGVGSGPPACSYLLGSFGDLRCRMPPQPRHRPANLRHLQQAQRHLHETCALQISWRACRVPARPHAARSKSTPRHRPSDAQLERDPQPQSRTCRQYASHVHQQQQQLARRSCIRDICPVSLCPPETVQALHPGPGLDRT